MEDFMDTNHRPLVRGRDTGIWNRRRLIRFAREHTKKGKIDKSFLSKLKKEAPGLSSRAIRGCP